MWAALLALPLFAAGPNRATAGACYDLQGCFRIKICAAGALKCCREPFSCNQCCPSGGYGGGCGTMMVATNVAHFELSREESAARLFGEKQSTTAR